MMVSHAKEKNGSDWMHARRIVGEVEEEGDTLQAAVLLEITGEETGSFQVDTHGTEDDGEVLLVAIVDTLVGNALLLDQASLSTNLGGDFVVGQTGGGEDGDLLSSGNRVHRVDGGDSGRDHLLRVFLWSSEGIETPINEAGKLTRE